MPHSDQERIARMEGAIDTVRDYIELDRAWKEKMDDKLDVMDRKFSKYIGFAGGIIFTLSAVWTLITFAFKVHNG